MNKFIKTLQEALLAYPRLVLKTEKNLRMQKILENEGFQSKTYKAQNLNAKIKKFNIKESQLLWAYFKPVCLSQH